MLRELSKALSELWRSTMSADRYRPERHYMRGPGPQWHARHGALVPVKGCRLKLCARKRHGVHRVQ